MPSRRGEAPLAPITLLIGTCGFLMARAVPPSSPWVCSIVVMQIAFATWLLAGHLVIWLRLLAAITIAALAAAVLLILPVPAHAVGSAFGGLCHTLAYASLLLCFALSLRPGREPVVTGFARRMRKTMSNDVVRYTRVVTAAWCVFFLAQLLVSLALVISAPQAVWSAFVNLWNLPLIVVMALGEYIVRSCLFSRRERTGFIATVSGLLAMRLPPGRSS